VIPQGFVIVGVMNGRSKLDTGPQKIRRLVTGEKGYLPFTNDTKQPGGNLLHKHKTIKSDVVEERPATMYIQIGIQISYTDLEK